MARTEKYLPPISVRLVASTHDALDVYCAERTASAHVDINPAQGCREILDAWARARPKR